MSKHTIHEPPHGGKPDPASIPARIPDTNWIHAGSLIQSILAELKEEMHEEALR